MDGFSKHDSMPYVYTFNSFLNSLEQLSKTIDKDDKSIRYGGYHHVGNNEDHLMYTLKEENANLKSQNQTLKNQNEQIKYELDNLKGVNNELKYNFDFLQNKFKNDMAITESVINEQNNKIKDLNNSLSKQKELIDSLQENANKSKQLNTQMNEMNDDQKQDNDQQIKTNVNDDEKFLKELEEKDEIIKDLAGKLEDTLNKLDYFVSERKEFLNKQNKIEELMQEKDKMIELLQQALKESEMQNNNNNKESSGNDNENNKDNDNSYKEMYELEKQKNNELMKTMEEIELKVSQLLTSQKEMKNFYETKIQSLEEQLTQIQQSNNNNNEIGNENQKLKDYITNQESQINDLKEHNNYLQKQLSKVPELEEQFKNLFEEMNLLQKENEFLKRSLSSPEKKHTNLDSIPKSKEGFTENRNFSDSAYKSAKPYLALYAILPDKLVSYNFSKGQMLTFKPEKYDEFIADYIEDGSITYNSLSSLLVLTSKNFNELYYYTYSDNTFSKLFTFQENHKNGCVFIDNASNNIYALGGEISKTVEKFSLEQMEIVSFPDLQEQRSHFTCCLIDDNLLYVFFGFSQSKNKCLDSIECIDLLKPENGWSLFACNNPLCEIRCMSVLPHDKNQMIVVGGERADGSANKNMIRFNGVENKIDIVNKDEFYNKKENKPFLFSKNAMFATYVGGNELLFCNMDDNMNPHFFDSDSNYETIFF